MPRRLAIVSNRRPEHFIYFVLARGANAVKIGMARNVKARMIEIQSCNPLALEVVATIRLTGYSDEYAKRSAQLGERLLHRKFDQFRLNGEWFLMSREVRDYIGLVQETGLLLEDETLSLEERMLIGAKARERSDALPPS